MSFQQKIEEMLELMNIPVISKFMLLSFEEAKLVFRDEIEKFRLLNQELSETQVQEFNLFPDVPIENSSQDNIIHVDWDYSRKNDKENYMDMFNLMENDPVLKDHIFKEFFLKLKPLAKSG